MPFFPQIRPDYGRFGTLCNWKISESDQYDTPIDDDILICALEEQAEEHERLASRYRNTVAVIEEYGIERCRVAMQRKNLHFLFKDDLNEIDLEIVEALGPTAEPF